jgi:hypothetical protein
MVAIKSYQADAFLKAVERVPAAVLFFGSDAGACRRAGRQRSQSGSASAMARTADYGLRPLKKDTKIP